MPNFIKKSATILPQKVKNSGSLSSLHSKRMTQAISKADDKSIETFNLETKTVGVSPVTNLDEIKTKNPDGTIKEATGFDKQGNEVYKYSYEYDENGDLVSIRKIEYTNNTNTINYYKDGKTSKKIITNNTTGKTLSQIDYDETGMPVHIYTYEYDNNGELVSSTFEDSIQKISQTTYYKDGEIIKFPNLIATLGNLKNGGLDDFNYFDYGDTKRLSESLSEVLSEQDIKDINEAIATSVKYAGAGSGKAVAAVAVTLITELKKRGIMLPYYYGGGHADFALGVNGNLGSDVVPSGGQKRYKKSFDCSGFVRWCIEMAGINCPGLPAGSFRGYGERISSVEELKPGSLLDGEEHVVMVVDKYTDENGTWHIICAESTGDNAENAEYDSSHYTKTPADHEGGVMLTDKSESEISGYTKVDMDSYYEQNKK